MKKIILTIGILIISLNCKSQNQKATLYFRNGDTIQGLAKMSAWGKIRFRKNKQSTTENYDGKTVSKFDIEEDSSYIPNTYIYKLLQNKDYSSRPVLMKMITEGKINLYKITTTGTSAPMGFGGMGMGMGMSYSYENYYVCRDNSDIVIKLTTLGTFMGENFIKAASEYFNDCIDLVNKIENKVYRKKDIEEIVKFYNTKCN
jgi:hypothetical protein